MGGLRASVWSDSVHLFSPELIFVPPPRDSVIPAPPLFYLVSILQSNRSTLRCSDLWIFIRFPLHELFALFSYKEKLEVGIQTKVSAKTLKLAYYLLL